MKGFRQAGMILLIFCMMLTAATGCQKKEGSVAPAKKEAAETPKAEPTQTGQEEAVNDGNFHGEYVVNAEYVKTHIGDENILFVDARGWKQAILGTVKGAIATTWTDLSTCQQGKEGDESWGKIPEASDFAERLGKLGIIKEKEIILISDTFGWGDDGRILWELLAAGFDNVKMLDGGMDAVKAAGVETQLFASEAQPQSVSIDRIDDTHLITTEELQKTYSDYKILDVRTDEEYAGEILHGEAQGGHLPGAVQFPFTDMFKEDGTLKSNQEIIAMCEATGLSKEDQIVTYCTGGIRSAYVQLVLEMCGFEKTKNYDQSFWRWAVVGEVE